MGFRVSALLMVLVATSVSSQLLAAPLADEGGAQKTGSICAAQEVSRDEQLVVQKQVEDWLSENAASLVLGGNIKIAWHVIYDGAIGNIRQSQIDSTVAILNAAFAGVPGGANTGYTFSLASVDRTNNRKWFAMEMASREEQQAKRALAIDVPHRLNIYSCRPRSGANWGIFPWSVPEGEKWHGVVLHINYLPGGEWSYAYTGDISVHEVGHYLGLYHTFQGGCTPPGDQVEDTPDEATAPNHDCPIGRDTCPSPGLDPIHNYMDYVSDPCRTEFTAGQDARIDSILPVYRPNLLNAAFSPDGPAVELASKERGNDLAPVAGVQFLGATPNPFGGTTEIRFVIAESKNVELKIYNAGGQLVAAPVNGPLSAGDHTVTFAGEDLPSGVYFAALRVDGQLITITRTMVLRR